MKAPRILTSSIVLFMQPEGEHPRPVHRSRLRTAAIVAAGAGLGYGGLKVGQAAHEVAQTLRSAGPGIAQTAKNAAAISGSVRNAGGFVAKPFRLLRHLMKFEVVRFVANTASVAADRYRKTIHEQEQNRAERNYTRSAVVGAGLGALLRKPGVTRGRGAAIGAGAGVVAQGLVRTATSGTRDRFGDRSYDAKRAEKLPWQVGGIAAGVLGYRRAVGKAGGLRKAVGFSRAGGSASEFVRLATPNLNRARLVKALIGGGALAGGITVSDVVSAASDPARNETTGQAAIHGLKKGAIYGGTLAASEPLLHAALKKASRYRTISASAKPRGVFHFRLGDLRHHSDVEARERGTGQFKDSLRGYIQGDRNYEGAEVQVSDRAVVRNAYRRAQDYTKWGGRAGRLLQDTVGGGRIDARGRAKKPEYQKKWVGDLAATGAVLGGAYLLKRNPKLRREIGNAVKGGPTRTTVGGRIADVSRRVQSGTPGVVEKLRKKASGLIDIDARLSKVESPRSKVVRFGETAPDWDVRDQRGRSARVFAPGAQARQRREKFWHERVENIRRIAVVGSVAGLAGGALLGWKLRGPKPNAVPHSESAASKVIRFPLKGNA